MSDWAYLPLGASARLAGDGRGALASARAERRFEPRVRPRRGRAGRDPRRRHGDAPGRQLHVAGGLRGADRLICVEVLTPDGNWSSYPPHKHDDTPDSLANNEEIYYFRVGRAGDSRDERDGFALHRTYTADGSIDATVVVRDGDVFLVPRGYHGPSVAAPGYPLYYLNVMAGPNAERTMAIVDDPPHAWVRRAGRRWADPRSRCR